MTDEIENAREDLAFMRALAESPDRHNHQMGFALFAGGLIYGFQTAVQWLVHIGVVPLEGVFYAAFIAACSLAFFLVLGVMIWRGRGRKISTTAGRAYEAAFQAAGLANLSIVLVFLAATFRSGSGEIWYFYTPLVFALQGAAWFVFFRLRKRAWLGLVATGWFAAAVGLGLTTHTSTYILVASLSLLTLLGLPGLVMMRLARQSDA